jgi:hypothetical protein
VPKDNRERFEEDYRDWIRLMSRDAACRLSALPLPEQKRILKAYEDFKNPGQVFRELSQAERVRSLAGERISSFIVVETSSITFFPSVCSPLPGALDYAVAMNRRLFCRKLWFPIISLNSEYIRQSPDHTLAFALEHEFEMSRIYQEISSSQKTVSPDEKRDIMISAQEIAQQKQTITPEELIEDERLMNQLSLSSPLLPKPYGEMALLHYLEANFPSLEPFGQKSASPEEEALGEELAEEFSSWSEFSAKTYELFVREIAANQRDANHGYA